MNNLHSECGIRTSEERRLFSMAPVGRILWRLSILPEGVEENETFGVDVPLKNGHTGYILTTL